MVRISAELIQDSMQWINPCRQRELSLRNQQIPAIENLGATKDQFDVIDLSDNNIRKMDNFPLLKRLDSLLLHNNRIQFIDRSMPDYLPCIRSLILTNNNIQELGDLEPLAKCKKLEYLTLLGNPVIKKLNYREYVIYKLKSVRVLDFKRITLAERERARKTFKGSAGDKLRKTVVKHTQQPLEETEADRVVALKGRPTEERQKIQELIKGAKTLADIEHVQAVLQTGKLASFTSTGRGMEVEDDDEEEEDEPMAVDQPAAENGNGAEKENGGPQQHPQASSTGGMEAEDDDEDDDE